MPQEEGIFLRFSRREREDAEIALATLDCDYSEDGIKDFFRKVASGKRILNGGQTVFRFFRG
jgi:hypothetical protein